MMPLGRMLTKRGKLSGSSIKPGTVTHDGENRRAMDLTSQTQVRGIGVPSRCILGMYCNLGKQIPAVRMKIAWSAFAICCGLN
jgi:hypothetical protein